MPNWRALILIVLSFLTGGASFGQPSCDEQLGPQILAQETLSNSVRAYIAIIEHYVTERPNELNSLVQKISQSNVFLNPIQKKVDSFSNQVADAIEHLRPSLALEEWLQIKKAVVRLQRNKQDEAKDRAEKKAEAGLVFGSTVISEVILPEEAEGRPYHFKQNNRSFVLLRTAKNSLLIFEVKNDRLNLIKEISLADKFKFMPGDEVSGMSVLSDQGRTYVTFSVYHTEAFPWENNHSMTLMEVKSDELVLLGQLGLDQEFVSTSVVEMGGDLYISSQSNEKMKVLRLRKASIASGLESVPSFERVNYSPTQAVWIKEHDHAYLAYNLRVDEGEDGKVMLVHKNFEIKKLNNKESRGGEREYDFTVSSDPVKFEINGQQYLAFGVYKNDQGYFFQVHKFSNGVLNLIAEAAVSGQVYSVFYFPESNSFIGTLLRGFGYFTLQDNTLNQVAEVTTKFSIIPSYVNVFTTEGRNYLHANVIDRSADVSVDLTYELTQKTFVKTRSIEWSQYAKVLSDRHIGETLLCRIKNKKLQLVRLKQPLKVKI